MESTDKGDLVMVPKIFEKATQLQHLKDMDAAERYTVLHLTFHVHILSPTINGATVALLLRGVGYCAYFQLYMYGAIRFKENRSLYFSF